jgi:hypothetical protein
MEACPKCNFVLAPEAAECPACGVILAKLKAVAGLSHQIRPVPPLAPPANPYAPPAAPVEGLSIPVPAAAPDPITRPTLEAFAAMRPWVRFIAVCGLVINTLTLLVALGLLYWSGDKPDLLPVAIVYFFITAAGFAILSPLNRSATALGSLHLQNVSGSLETFAVEQSTFWRRMGALCIAYLVIIGIIVVLGGLAGTLAATLH